MGIQNIIKLHKLRMLLVFFVFILFLASALGILNFNVISGLNISISGHLGGKGTIISKQILAATEFRFFVLIGIVLSILLPVLDPLKASLLAFIAMVIPMGINYYSPASNSLPPMEYTLLTILMLYIINVLISYFIEIHAKQQIIDTFGRYIPQQVVNEISISPEKISLDGEARELTVLFCDIQNFTQIAENLNPRQVTHLLNEYFTALTKILYGYNATIDKFIGDAVMAFWGAPGVQKDHAKKSVLAALDMQIEIKRLSMEFISRGWPGPNAGIGINTGLMNVGNMGSEYRIVYTVIGDAVNIASRIEKLTRFYQVPIIVHESTMRDSNDILFRELDLVTVKGKQMQTRIYQPLGMKNEAGDKIIKRLEKHNEGLMHYYKQQWDQSSLIFNELLNEDPADKYYSVMLDKINNIKIEN